MTPKQKRTVERDLEALFSPRAIHKKPTVDNLKRLALFHPRIKYKRGTLFLSEVGKAAIERLTEILCVLTEFSDSVSRRETYSLVLENYEKWLNKHLQPNGQEFTGEIFNSLRLIVKDYEFLVKVEGLDLKDIGVIDLGSVRILRSDSVVLENVKFRDNLDFESIYKEFKDCVWMIGRSRGSPDIASEQFDLKAVLTSGILGICGAVLYKDSVWRTRVRPVTSPYECRKPVSGLRWEVGGSNPSYTRKLGELNLTLDSTQVAYLTQTCFLKEMASLLDRKRRNELQDAIARALYWFAEAYHDRSPTMQFVKLWSCAECFFTIQNSQITEFNARGIASVLAFAGYQVIDPGEYAEFKNRLKRLYARRSRAVHRAKFHHISSSDLGHLSHWIAWLIISMVALSERGYTTLQQVHNQASKLDGLSLKDK